MTDESGKSTFHIVLSNDYFDKLAQNIADSGGTQQMLEQYAAQRAQFSEMRVDIYVTIDQATANVDQMKMTTHFQKSPEAGGDSIDMDIDTRFTDYGKTVEINLPAEAANAEYVDRNALTL